MSRSLSFFLSLSLSQHSLGRSALRAAIQAAAKLAILFPFSVAISISISQLYAIYVHHLLLSPFPCIALASTANCTSSAQNVSGRSGMECGLARYRARKPSHLLALCEPTILTTAFQFARLISCCTHRLQRRIGSLNG